MLIILIAINIFAIVAAIKKYLSNYSHQNVLKTQPPKTHIDTFSVSNYFDTIEKELLSILKEKEKIKPGNITLWWGLDGLQINDDGTTEWIRKNEGPKSVPYHISSKIQNTISPSTYQVDRYSFNVSQNCDNQSLMSCQMAQRQHDFINQSILLQTKQAQNAIMQQAIMPQANFFCLYSPYPCYTQYPPYPRCIY